MTHTYAVLMATKRAAAAEPAPRPVVQKIRRKWLTEDLDLLRIGVMAEILAANQLAMKCKVPTP